VLFLERRKVVYAHIAQVPHSSGKVYILAQSRSSSKYCWYDAAKKKFFLDIILFSTFFLIAAQSS
jgi:hypothetical protein